MTAANLKTTPLLKQSTMTRSRTSRSLRLQIAQSAARMLAEGECADTRNARNKAALRLHCRDQRQMPDNHEIEAALRDYQQLFQRDRQPARLRQLRQTAVEAMRNLAQFTPRLTGRVLTGTAGPDTAIRLYLFAETPDAVAFYLLERSIPFEQRELKLPYTGGTLKQRALFRFQAGDCELELLVLPPNDRAAPPLDPLNNQPSTGAPLAQVERLARD